MCHALDMVVGAWQANGILMLRTGQPLTLADTARERVRNS